MPIQRPSVNAGPSNYYLPLRNFPGSTGRWPVPVRRLAERLRVGGRVNVDNLVFGRPPKPTGLRPVLPGVLPTALLDFFGDQTTGFVGCFGAAFFVVFGVGIHLPDIVVATAGNVFRS